MADSLFRGSTLPDNMTYMAPFDQLSKEDQAKIRAEQGKLPAQLRQKAVAMKPGVLDYVGHVLTQVGIEPYPGAAREAAAAFAARKAKAAALEQQAVQMEQTPWTPSASGMYRSSVPVPLTDLNMPLGMRR